MSVGSSSPSSRRRPQFVTFRNAGVRLSRSSVQVKVPGVVRVPQRRNRSIYAGVFSFHMKIGFLFYFFWRKEIHLFDSEHGFFAGLATGSGTADESKEAELASALQKIVSSPDNIGFSTGIRTVTITYVGTPT